MIKARRFNEAIRLACLPAGSLMAFGQNVSESNALSERRESKGGLLFHAGAWGPL